VQRAFAEHGATQCGFCTPGFVLSAVALLRETPKPSREEVERAIAGNLCRCTGYTKIVEAILAAAERPSRAEAST
jgi:carbon-monoxide dehydrogenase small subunit